MRAHRRRSRAQCAAYGSSMRRDISPEDEAERLVRLREREGFDAFKVRIGKELGHDEDEWPGPHGGVVVARYARPSATTWRCWSTPTAATRRRRRSRSGRMLEEHGVSHFEEPCPYWELDWTREVAEALELDVAGGEQDWDERVWRMMSRCEPSTSCSQTSATSEGSRRHCVSRRSPALPGMPVHATLGEPVARARLHAASARVRLENPGPYVEFSIEPDRDYPWQVGMYEPRSGGRRRDGHHPDRAGLGSGDLSRMAVEIRASLEHTRLKLWPACPACRS